MARRPAAAGSTPVCTPTESTRQRGDVPAVSSRGSRRNGAGPGPPIDEFSITGHRRIPKAGRGVTAKAYVWWDESSGRWTGPDVPDFEITKPPSYRPEPGTGGVDGIAGDDPFIMQADGKAWLFAPFWSSRRAAARALRTERVTGAKPLLSPASKPRTASLQANRQPPEPLAARAKLAGVPLRIHDLSAHRTPHRGRHEPLALPTCRSCNRSSSAKYPQQLAALRGLQQLGWATIVTARTAIEARVLVTDRMAALTVDGRTVHQIGLPYHWESERARCPAETRPTTCSVSRSTQMCTSRRTRRPRAIFAPAGDLPGPPCSSSSPTTVAALGSRRRPAIRAHPC